MCLAIDIMYVDYILIGSTLYNEILWEIIVDILNISLKCKESSRI